MECFYKFVGYEYEIDLFDQFETQYMNYVSKTYKDDELAKQIDIIILKDKINREIESISELIKALSIFNNVSSNRIEKCVVSFVYSRDLIDSYYTDKPMLNSGELQRELESFVCKVISEQISEILYYSSDNIGGVLEKLGNAEEGCYYIRPKFDILSRSYKTREEYNESLNSLKIIETDTVIAERLLVKDFNCCLEYITCTVQSVNDDYINSTKKNLLISENTYCKENINGVEIIYNESEIETYLRQSYVQVDIEVAVGIDVIGDNNVVFLREDS